MESEFAYFSVLFTSVLNRVFNAPPNIRLIYYNNYKIGRFTIKQTEKFQSRLKFVEIMRKQFVSMLTNFGINKS